MTRKVEIAISRSVAIEMITLTQKISRDELGGLILTELKDYLSRPEVQEGLRDIFVGEISCDQFRSPSLIHRKIVLSSMKLPGISCDDTISLFSNVEFKLEA